MDTLRFLFFCFFVVVCLCCLRLWIGYFFFYFMGISDNACLVFFLFRGRAEKCVMASSGFQADVKALQKVLSARHLVSLKSAQHL